MKLLFLLLTLTSCFAVLAKDKKPKAQPNVLLIMVDDLNDYVGFLGGHPQTKTPGMDALASESVVFTNAFSNNPICAPSRASFFSGLYPHTSKNFGFKKFQKNPTLMGSKTMMEMFRSNGYTVVGAGKLMHHHDKKLFDEYGDKSDFGPFPWNGEKISGHPSVPEAFRNVGTLDGSFAPLTDIPEVNGYKGWYDKQNGWPITVKPFKYINDDNRDKMPDEVKAANIKNYIKKFEKSNSDKPFFMAVGFNRPHTPLYVPQKYYDMFPLESVQLPQMLSDVKKINYYTQKQGNNGHKGTEHFTKLIEGFDGKKEYALKKYIQAYLACIAFVDDQINDVLTTLKESEFAENTIVVLVSDHAYEMGDKDYLYKNALWDNATRIPMIIHEPGMKKTQKVDQPVSLIDIYPTLVDLCGLKGSTIKNEEGRPLDGNSMQPLYNNKAGSWEGKEYALSAVTGGQGDVVKRNHFSIRTKEYRYICYANKTEELYDHTKDPNEFNNVVDDPAYAKVKEQLSNQLLQEIGLAN
ncbi:sulfatase [Flammeovirga sp. SubArs3]|uniref:sulfatase n=1 Tax=Flammeovirga sp. SubArs3 TaxID=2995316 RepID=UPI00248CC8E4|nr:sulfatase [Flammeovirga sp. SubArs3]